MKKLFLRQISLILVLAMLLSLTGVAEDVNNLYGILVVKHTNK